ncbi:PREDICTED: MICOS complex subunit Mic60-like [Dipodomys ordii]|uniref:MICOS complex subunit MIC60 n=1 Tax=Dipodomys ordii TaxID=10020 RepID=A0A1S3GPT4_DIPOR|nr:PREDICTED: MICOS complex subunit Mic60-like [Dipodomys ordii]
MLHLINLNWMFEQLCILRNKHISSDWKPVYVRADKLSTDDLNSLIAHAHRRIDQLNRELAQQKAIEKQHIALALEQQKAEEKRAFDAAVAKALERHRDEIQAEQDKKVEVKIIDICVSDLVASRIMLHLINLNWMFEQLCILRNKHISSDWKPVYVRADKLSTDDLNSLIAHAHRRIDQLNRELAQQKAIEKQHIALALEQQKAEEKRAFDAAVAKALERHRDEIQAEQDKKVEEVRDAMENEMRTQLRRQAAAHTDHLRDVLRVQEQELKYEYDKDLSEKLSEKELEFRRRSQEQVDSFTLDINTAYARLRGIEQAVQSHAVAEEEARKAHQLWLSVEALKYSMKTSSADRRTIPLENAVEAIRVNCSDNEFAQALTAALPPESLTRGVYSEETLRARFYAVQKLAGRVAMIDETRNSLYQYFLSYLQSLLLFPPQQLKPPAELCPEDINTFKLLSYASYCIEHGDLELAAKFVNQLKGESRRVAQDWLKEARMTLETKQIVEILTAYASAVGLGSTKVHEE